ncbi:MAG TPA: hypothetical protein VFM71_11795 [Gemmatimonadaceae bacterium]|nr:hypothetical protein [Gemmatimonadaceae bacterium]
MLFAIAALAVPCLASDAGAQAMVVASGNGSARINLLARATVGYRMNVRQSEPARVVASNVEATEIEVPVTAASNVRWTLSVLSPSGADAEDGDIEVLDANGTWRTLDDDNAAAVYSSAAPTNGQPVNVRLRVAPGADLDSVSTVRFLMTPSDR